MKNHGKRPTLILTLGLALLAACGPARFGSYNKDDGKNSKEAFKKKPPGPTILPSQDGFSFNIVYQGNGNTEGTVPTDFTSYPSGTAVTVLGNTGMLGRTGYSFGGWTLEGSPTVYAAGQTLTMGTAALTLYAKWTLASCSGLQGGSWVLVPGDPLYGTADFCMMKYVPSDSNGRPLSQPVSLPWTAISQTTAKANCSGLGGGYHLTTNPEWMTVAAHAAQQPSNWSGSLVGTGSLARGHSDKNPLEACAADANDANAWVDGDCTGQAQGAKLFSQRRTQLLANSQVIWDVGGNVWQWLDYRNSNDKPLTGNEWREYPLLTGSVTTPKSALVPLQGRQPWWTDSWNSAQAVGMFLSGDNGLGGALARGGSSNVLIPDYAGAFAAILAFPAETSATDIGFRCSYTPPNVAAALRILYDSNNSTSGTAPLDANLYSAGQMVAVAANSGGLARTGATFAGWNPAADGSGKTYTAGQLFTLGNTSATLYAKWNFIDYTVSYNGNGSDGGTVPTAMTGNYLQDITIASPGTLSKRGYSFSNWNTQANGSGTSYAPAAKLKLGDMNVVLYAQWKVNSYTLSYAGNGSDSGTAPSPMTGIFQGQITVANPGTLGRQGHTFVNWNTKMDGSGTTYAPGASFPVGDMDATLYAQWSANSYTLSYNGNGSDGGSAPSSTLATYGTNISVAGPGPLSRRGHTFVNWNTQMNGSGTAYAPGASFRIGDVNAVLYAQWSVNSYTLSYNGNGSDGGTVPNPMSAPYLSSITVANPGSLFKVGFRFVSWNTQLNGAGTAYAPGTSFGVTDANVTLYAQWAPNTYTLTYNGNSHTGGTAPAAVTNSPGSIIVVAAKETLTKTNFVFNGWNTMADGTGSNHGVGSSLTLGNANITLYAKWVASAYTSRTLTYSGNGHTSGTVPASVSVATGTQVTLAGSGNLSRTGFVFDGWNTRADGTGTHFSASSLYPMGSSSVTLYAKWR